MWVYKKEEVDALLHKLTGNCKVCLYSKECADSGNSRKGPHRNCWIPSISPEQVDVVQHAHWIAKQREWDFEPFYYIDYTCSACGKRSHYKDPTCWNCDAVMDNGEPRTAHWIENADEGLLRCSNPECNAEFEDNGYTIKDYWKFCPHCGLPMSNELEERKD